MGKNCLGENLSSYLFVMWLLSFTPFPEKITLKGKIVSIFKANLLYVWKICFFQRIKIIEFEDYSSL